MTHTNIIRAALTAATITLIGLALPSTVLAHHTTITCTDPDTATWSIVNSENRDMTFTTNQGHTGSIGPRGTAQVVHNGTSLTVYGVWNNGQSNTSTGQGDCEWPDTTTTTPDTTSTSSTTVAPTSTVPDTTISSSVPNPTVTEPSVSPPPITGPAAPTEPAVRGDQTPGDVLPDPCLIGGERHSVWVAVDPVVAQGTTEFGFIPCAVPAAATSVPVEVSELPATGSEHAWVMAIVATFLVFGGAALIAATRRDGGQA